MNTSTELSASQKGFSPLFIVLGILLITGIAGGAYYLGKTQIPKPQPQNPVITSQAQPLTTTSSVVPSSTPYESANWKTYTSKNTLFSFKYPPFYSLKDPEGTMFINPASRNANNYDARVSVSPCDFDHPASENWCGGMEINIFGVAVQKNTKNMDMDNWINSSNAPLSACKKKNSSNINRQDFNGDKSVNFEWTDTGCVLDPNFQGNFNAGQRKEVIIFHKQDIIIISIFYTRDKFKSQFDQILSTFKFTDQSQTSNLSKEKCPCWDSIHNTCLPQSSCE